MKLVSYFSELQQIFYDFLILNLNVVLLKYLLVPKKIFGYLKKYLYFYKVHLTSIKYRKSPIYSPRGAMSAKTAFKTAHRDKLNGFKSCSSLESSFLIE